MTPDAPVAAARRHAAQGWPDRDRLAVRFDIKAIPEADGEFLPEAVRALVQAALEQEMTTAIGAAAAEDRADAAALASSGVRAARQRLSERGRTAVGTSTEV